MNFKNGIKHSMSSMDRRLTLESSFDCNANSLEKPIVYSESVSATIFKFASVLTRVQKEGLMWLLMQKARLFVTLISLLNFFNSKTSVHEV